MKALSGYAEWFWLMAKNWKDVENRPRPLPKEMAFNLPVRIYLHASLTKTPKDQIDFIKERLTRQQIELFNAVEWWRYRGHIIGEITITKQFKKVELTERDHTDIGSQNQELVILKENNEPYMSRWFFGKYGYAVEDGILYDNPIYYKGQLGFFELKR